MCIARWRRAPQILTWVRGNGREQWKKADFLLVRGVDPFRGPL